jgi:hypothetical protein
VWQASQINPSPRMMPYSSPPDTEDWKRVYGEAGDVGSSPAHRLSVGSDPDKPKPEDIAVFKPSGHRRLE